MGDRTCTVPKCGRRYNSNGLCEMHYARMRRTGRVDRPSAEERFFAQVEQVDGCWLWRGCLRPDGYGLFQHAGARPRAHRWAYEFMRSEIPEGLTLDHECRRRNCVNPWHLDPVPIAVNTMRGFSPLANNRRKTACVKGHPFDDSNTRRTRSGGRECRTCGREAQANLRARRRLPA